MVGIVLKYTWCPHLHSFKNQRWSANVELVYIDFDRRMFTEERSIKRPHGLADDRCVRFKTQPYL